MKLPVIENCSNCGACCMHMGGTPSVLAYKTREDSRTSRQYGPKLPPELNAELLQLIAGWTANNNWPGDDDPCIWFDPSTKGCRHYRYRPYVCREFEVGSEGCVAHRLAREIGGAA